MLRPQGSSARQWRRMNQRRHGIVEGQPAIRAGYHMWRKILQFFDRVIVKFFDRVIVKIYNRVIVKFYDRLIVRFFNRLVPYDPEAKVAKAIALLKSKNVAENINTLLNRYFANAGGIDIKRDAACSVELITALGAKEIAESITYTFNQKVIQFLVADMRGSYTPDDSTNYGNLFVLFNGECVLHNDLMFHDKGYKHYGVNFSTSSLKSLKVSIWIDDLRYLVKALTDLEMRARDKQRAESISRTASNIDFGKQRHG